MAGNSTLRKANKEKQDEFYTQLTDIEKEMRNYRQHFKGKTVLCNCDDPFESNFFKYFAMNFNVLGLKKLIVTCYAASPIAGQEIPILNNQSYKIEINEVKDENGDGAIDLTDVEILVKDKKNILTLLKGNGDFRSEECIKILKKADIVVTNPPFSLFREYVAQLVELNKDFIILGNQNAITYKEIFPLLKDNKVWLGKNNGDMKFKVPAYYPKRETRFWIDETGQKWRSLGNICWFTTLDYKQRHENLILYKEYSQEEYKKYDDFDAINVEKYKEIPINYDGLMGVPVTFMSKYSPEQFEIVGNLGSYAPDGYSFAGAIHINGSKVFKRILIRKKKG